MQKANAVAVVVAVLALSAAACGGSSTPTPTPTASPSSTATPTPTATTVASPTPTATPTPSAAAISLSCPSASEVSTDFQTPFGLQPPGAGNELIVNGPPPPGNATVSQCTYTDSADNISMIIVLATGFPAADFSTAEQDITHQNGWTVTGSQTFDPQSDLGDQAVDYDFAITIASTGSNYEQGTIAIQGTNLVSVQGLGNTFTPDQSMFNTLIGSLLS